MQERVVCPTCAGAKFTTQIGTRKPCWKCLASGYIIFIKVTCNRCYGNGVIDQGINRAPLKCPTCDGAGTVREPGR